VSRPVAFVRRRWSRSSVPSASYSLPRRSQSRGQRHSTPSSLSLARAPSSPRRRRCFGELARVSPCLRPSDSVHRSASFPMTPSSSWLQLPSLGKPALPSPSRAYLAEAPPWSPASWPGLCSPPFFLILVPKAPLGAFSSALSPARDTSGQPHTTAVPPFTRARYVWSSRVRVSGTARCGMEWGA